MKYFLILLTLFISACSNHQENTMKIAVNSWIGYTPLFYAQERGYLKNLGIQLIPTISLAESLNLFNVKKVNALAGTQHEYNALKVEFPTLQPIILLDRSNGADMILSNRPISQLKKSKHILAYLEIDSINLEMVQTFIKNNHLKEKNINFINKNQLEIQNIPYRDKPDLLLVTYSPYNIKLTKNGFKEISSTNDIKSLLVIDAIMTTQGCIDTYKNKMLALKIIINRSIQEIKKNPKIAYNSTKKYLRNISYKDFKKSLKMIEWINHPSKELLEKLDKINYKESNLL
jgi:NitT/TauT family transport system substrate-binding protein